ncbi:RDD family protein [Variovorax sp. RTB1]|jgi:uncharacterized RDD family membrane protein YckC|uniref:RDD family protein n=1 Tax=Variovorax sp. RTB1 TaxID=3048631 RepID=UPI002B23994B|nr:RDD family protein [Variovorax sp. RTB1]MEB0114563.1 RDD family protein [Variovorax sp. RTB1]
MHKDPELLPFGAMPPLPVSTLGALAERRDELLSLPLAGPWRRLLAKLIDVYFYVLVVAVPGLGLASYFLPGFGAAISTPGMDQLLGLLVIPFSLLVEAVIFGWTGGSFGKWLLGLKVITIAGGRPTFAQYLRRQAGLWWAGLALGIPLIGLITLNHQHTRVKAGNNASYDVGRFNVNARPIGLMRKANAMLVTAAIAIGMVALIGFGNEEDRAMRTPVAWTNPTTGVKVSLPAGWGISALQKSKELAPNLYWFVNRRTRVEVLFASDAVPQQYSLDDYLVAWSHNVQESMDIGTVGVPAEFNGHPTLEARGLLKGEKPLDIKASIMRRNESVWRLLVFGKNGIGDSADTRALHDVLFGTL